MKKFNKFLVFIFCTVIFWFNIPVKAVYPRVTANLLIVGPPESNKDELVQRFITKSMIPFKEPQDDDWGAVPPSRSEAHFPSNGFAQWRVAEKDIPKVRDGSVYKVSYLYSYPNKEPYWVDFTVNTFTIDIKKFDPNKLSNYYKSFDSVWLVLDDLSASVKNIRDFYIGVMKLRGIDLSKNDPWCFRENYDIIAKDNRCLKKFGYFHFISNNTKYFKGINQAYFKSFDELSNYAGEMPNANRGIRINSSTGYDLEFLLRVTLHLSDTFIHPNTATCQVF